MKMNYPSQTLDKSFKIKYENGFILYSSSGEQQTDSTASDKPRLKQETKLPETCNYTTYTNNLWNKINEMTGDRQNVQETGKHWLNWGSFYILWTCRRPSGRTMQSQDLWQMFQQLKSFKDINNFCRWNAWLAKCGNCVSSLINYLFIFYLSIEDLQSMNSEGYQKDRIKHRMASDLLRNKGRDPLFLKMAYRLGDE